MLLQFLIAIIIAPLCKINSQVILLFCFSAATAEHWETLVNKIMDHFCWLRLRSSSALVKLANFVLHGITSCYDISGCINFPFVDIYCSIKTVPANMTCNSMISVVFLKSQLFVKTNLKSNLKFWTNNFSWDYPLRLRAKRVGR